MPPPPHFLLSYGRADGPHVTRFYEDLVAAVRAKNPAYKGLSAGAVGYMDTRTEHGDDFDHALLTALRRSKTYIALISVSYLASDYCGREFAVFRNRVDRHVPGSRLIKPVLWQPEWRLGPLPDVLARIQHSHHDYGEVYQEKGLAALVKQQRYRDDYEEFLDAFSWALVNDVKECDLPEITAGPTLDEVVSPFMVVPPPDPARVAQLERVRDLLAAQLRQPAVLAAVRAHQLRPKPVPVRKPSVTQPQVPASDPWTWVVLGVLIALVILYLITRPG
ncbi:toll/interleukin-1 receptor domain-containing protein [Lentzea alba]|uniref:TIR domain-containing protein n=1 Tax=Lentzea alba TaxID=2714351 RepID=UPI0039BEDAEA